MVVVFRCGLGCFSGLAVVDCTRTEHWPLDLRCTLGLGAPGRQAVQFTEAGWSVRSARGVSLGGPLQQ